MDIFVVALDGREMHIHTKPSMLVRTLKQKVEFEQGLSSENIILTYQGNNLPEDKTLANCGIKTDSKLFMARIPKSSKVTINIVLLNTKTVILKAKLSDKIKSLKHNLETKEKILKEDQTLLYQGKVLDDNKRLRDYNITKDCVFHLLLNPSPYSNIFLITEEGYSFPIRFIRNDEKISELKNRIESAENFYNEKRIIFLEDKSLRII